MFKTARFKIHNPSRHKIAMLHYALEGYHRTLKHILETALADDSLEAKISETDSKGRLRCNRYKTGKLLYKLAPQGWALAPLRDYLIGDATAALMSHFAKRQKGRNDSNPPTLRALEAPSAQQIAAVTEAFSRSIEFPIKPNQQEKIIRANNEGQRRVAARLENIYRSWAATREAGKMLRSLESPLPRPIEFTRSEFERGFVLARSENNFYVLLRLFGKKSRYRKEMVLKDDFTDLRTGELIGGKTYPGIALPLEIGRLHHEREFLEHGRPQSAKLLIRRNLKGNEEFYVHVSFEFEPPKIECQSYMGIDRGAAMIGAAVIITTEGRVLDRSNLQGKAFSQEMAELRRRIAKAQHRAQRKRRRLFGLRARRSKIIIGEYANLVIARAAEHKSQIVLEKIDARSMARFLTQSQFRKLQSALEYKAARAGLPAPMEVPAARTSQTCGQCGHWHPGNRPKKDAEGKPIQDVFRCLSCGFEANADENAAHVIAFRGLHQALNGGEFQKFAKFQGWMKSFSGRDGLPG